MQNSVENVYGQTKRKTSIFLKQDQLGFHGKRFLRGKTAHKKMAYSLFVVIFSKLVCPSGWVCPQTCSLLKIKKHVSCLFSARVTFDIIMITTWKNLKKYIFTILFKELKKKQPSKRKHITAEASAVIFAKINYNHVWTYACIKSCLQHCWPSNRSLSAKIKIAKIKCCTFYQSRTVIVGSIFFILLLLFFLNLVLWFWGHCICDFTKL